MSVVLLYFVLHVVCNIILYNLLSNYNDSLPTLEASLVHTSTRSPSSYLQKDANGLMYFDPVNHPSHEAFLRRRCKYMNKYSA